MCLVLEVGKVYVDSEGDKVRIVADFGYDRRDTDFLFVGVYINPNQTTRPLQFSLDGRGKHSYQSIHRPAPLIKEAPTPHPHAESMMLYAQDAAECEKPWLRWEYKCKEEASPKPTHNVWRAMPALSNWLPEHEYRRLPQSKWPPEAY